MGYKNGIGRSGEKRGEKGSSRGARLRDRGFIVHPWTRRGIAGVQIRALSGLWYPENFEIASHFCPRAWLLRSRIPIRVILVFRCLFLGFFFNGLSVYMVFPPAMISE